MSYLDVCSDERAALEYHISVNLQKERYIEHYLTVVAHFPVGPAFEAYTCGRFVEAVSSRKHDVVEYAAMCFSSQHLSASGGFEQLHERASQILFSKATDDCFQQINHLKQQWSDQHPKGADESDTEPLSISLSILFACSLASRKVHRLPLDDLPTYIARAAWYFQVIVRLGCKPCYSLEHTDDKVDWTGASQSLQQTMDVIESASCPQEDLLDAGCRLQVCLHHQSSYPGVHFWIGHVSDGFLARIQQREPFSLLILTHWLVCFPCLETVWWGQGWRHDMFTATSSIVNESQRALLGWCGSSLGTEARPRSVG